METKWQTLDLVDDYDRPITDEENRVRYLREYRANGTMTGAYFATPLAGQDPESPWTWGPQPDEIDWADFPAAVLRTDTRAYEDQGLIDPTTEPKGLTEWLDAVVDEYDATYVGPLRGWGEYTALVKLQPINSGGSALYYLVTSEALRGLGIPDPYDLVATGDIARLAGVDRATVGQWQHRELLPAPVATTSGGKVWLRSDIESWLRKTGRLS